MKGHFHSIVGWEKFAGEWLLRMKLAEPELKSVWPGLPSTERPDSETRLLAEEVLTVDNVTRAITDSAYRHEQRYTHSDLKLFWRALAMHPGNNSGGGKKYRVRIDGPPL